MSIAKEEIRPYFDDELSRLAFENAAIGMVLIGLDGKWLAVNDALCRINGYNPEELLKQTIQTISHKDDVESDLTLMKKLVEGEIDHYTIKKRFIHKQGHPVWALKSVSLVRESSGNPLFFIAQIQDISEKIRLENELAESNRSIENILENSQCVIAQYDRQKRILFANQILSDVLDKPLAEIIGKTVSEISDVLVNPVRLEAVISEVLETKESRFLETTRPIKGEIGYLSTHFTPQFDENGEVETVIALAFNITQLKKTQFELSKALSEVKELQAIVPVCAQCQKVRDDNHYWHSVENYFLNHTNTKFSHGICPHCYETVIQPQLDALKASKQKENQQVKKYCGKR